MEHAISTDRWRYVGSADSGQTIIWPRFLFAHPLNVSSSHSALQCRRSLNLNVVLCCRYTFHDQKTQDFCTTYQDYSVSVWRGGCLKALVNIVLSFKNLSCMTLHAIRISDWMYKWTWGKDYASILSLKTSKSVNYDPLHFCAGLTVIHVGNNKCNFHRYLNSKCITFIVFPFWFFFLHLNKTRQISPLNFRIF